MKPNACPLYLECIVAAFTAGFGLINHTAPFCCRRLVLSQALQQETGARKCEMTVRWFTMKRMSLVVMLVMMTGILRGQTTLEYTFDSSDDISGWYTIGRLYDYTLGSNGYGVKDGSFALGFNVFLSEGDAILPPEIRYSPRESGAYFAIPSADLPDAPGWELKASFLLTEEMVNNPQWGWSQNLVANTYGGFIYVGAFNDAFSDKTVWRTAMRMNVTEPYNWTAYDTVEVHAGWNTVAIRAFDDYYSVVVNGTVLGTSAYLNSIMGPDTLVFGQLSGYPSFPYNEGFYIPNEVEGSEWGTYHLIFDNVSLSGISSAVPEPSTYAGIAGAVVLGFVLLRRRGKATT